MRRYRLDTQYTEREKKKKNKNPASANKTENGCRGNTHNINIIILYCSTRLATSLSSSPSNHSACIICIYVRIMRYTAVMRAIYHGCGCIHAGLILTYDRAPRRNVIIKQPEEYRNGNYYLLQTVRW